MSYSDFGPHRRSRRRRNVVVLITVLVIVGVLALAVRYRTERRESIDYLSTAEEVALQHAEMADFLGALFHGLGQEDRPAVELRLDTLALDASEARARLDELVVTRPVAETSGLMTVAVTAWGDGVVTLKNAIIAVLDAEENALTADEELRAACEMLRLGVANTTKSLLKSSGEPFLCRVFVISASDAEGTPQPQVGLSVGRDRIPA